MGHPYRERHTTPESTTTDNITGLTGAKAVKQAATKAATKSNPSKGKRSSK